MTGEKRKAESGKRKRGGAFGRCVGPQAVPARSALAAVGVFGVPTEGEKRKAESGKRKRGSAFGRCLGPRAVPARSALAAVGVFGVPTLQSGTNRCGWGP